MTTYRVSNVGHNVALGSLNVLDPQPHSLGVQTSRRSFAADSTAYDEGRYIEFLFNYSDDPTTYVALLTLFGVNVSLNANVTIYAPDERFAWTRMNGVAIRPSPGRDVSRQNFFIRDIVILVRDLAASS